MSYERNVMKYALAKYFSIATLIIIFDRLTKQSAYALEHAHEITTWLSIEKAINRGVSWGLFNGSDQRVFMLVIAITSLLTIAVAVHGYFRYKNGHAIWGETLLSAGSFSNIIDRFLYGGVVDFVHLQYESYSWPLFNIADICIVLGVIILFFTNIRD